MSDEPETILQPSPGTTEINGHAETTIDMTYGKTAYFFVGSTVGILIGSIFGSWCATSANVGSLTKHDVLQMAADSHQTKYDLQVHKGETKNTLNYQETWIRNLDKAVREDRELNRNTEYRLAVIEGNIRRLMSDRADEQIKEEMEAKK